MTREEIERAKAAGAEKRKARQAKREAEARELESRDRVKLFCLSESFRERLEAAWNEMERAHFAHTEISPELIKEVKALFLPNEEEEFRFEVYQKLFYDYETLIFYAWIANDELCEATFNFWDGVLSHPDVLVSGNSILRIFCSKPNQKLLKIIKNHKDVLLDEAPFRIAMKDIVERYLLEPGLYNFETKSFDLWTDEEREILEKIKELF